ncbi:hypothetical protein GCM10023080_066150 [Streptomyces pseudoechinosporeus]
MRPSILDLPRRLPHAAALVLSATYEVIAHNDLAAALLEDFSALPRHERNFLRRTFLDSRVGERQWYSRSGMEIFGRTAARHLRAAAARYPDDPEVATLVNDLLTGSAEFARLWAAYDIRHTAHGRTRLTAASSLPMVGRYWPFDPPHGPFRLLGRNQLAGLPNQRERWSSRSC